MDLLHNPFHVLGVSPWDDRKALHDAAEERSLFDAPEECTAALDALINPRKRLAAEVAWFTNDDPNLPGKVLDLLKTSPGRIESYFDTPPLDRANIIASSVFLRPELSPEDLARRIQVLGEAFDLINRNDLLRRINEKRARSGFPAINSSLLEEELEQRRRWFRQVLKDGLDTLPPAELVRTVALVVDSSTDKGMKHAPLLVDDLLDSFELEAQPFFEREKRNIEKTMEKMKKAAEEKRPEHEILSMMEDLKRALKNWDMVIKPIRTGMRARGLAHSASEQMGSSIRSLSIDMFNMHGLLKVSLEFNRTLRDVFRDVPGVLEHLERDARDLFELEKVRNQQNIKKFFHFAFIAAGVLFYMYLFAN